jgi:hypothetical protein
LTSHVKDSTRKSIRERVYSVLNNITEVPKCLVCSNNVNFLKSGNYGKYCSLQCLANDKEVREGTNNKISISVSKYYQSIINKEGTDYSGVVYILHFPQHNAVKIGLSGDFEQRTKGLYKDFGNFEVIQLIETDYSHTLENELHQKFSEYRICLEEGCGRTEFFKEEILEKLSNF